MTESDLLKIIGESNVVLKGKLDVSRLATSIDVLLENTKSLSERRQMLLARLKNIKTKRDSSIAKIPDEKPQTRKIQSPLVPAFLNSPISFK